MSRLNGLVAVPASAHVVADPYAPLTFESDPERADADRVLTFRSDDDSVLVELGLNSIAGRLVRSALVHYKGPVPERAPMRWLSARTEAGLPTFDLIGFKDDSWSRVDEVASCALAYTPSGLYVSFGADDVDRIIAADRARFLFAADRLVGIGFEDLTPEERGVVLDAVSLTGAPTSA